MFQEVQIMKNWQTNFTKLKTIIIIPVSLRNIWDGDLAEMQFVSKFNIENAVIQSKYEWVAPWNDKKSKAIVKY